MNHIASDKLQHIAENTSKLINEINNGVEWAEKFLKDEHRSDTAYALKKYRRKLKKVQKAVTQKPTIALFGASQVGKSYLVKNILVDENNEFLIPDYKNDIEYDYIKDINPEGGGSEATSVVTRFTYDENFDKNLPQVKIRLLSAQAVIIILVDTYLSDIKSGRKEFNVIEIEEHLSNIHTLYSSTHQYYLDDDNVYDIQDYITEIFGDLTTTVGRIKTFEDANFWNIVAENIHKIPYTNWSKVFDILWGKKEELTNLFNLLITELSNVRFSDVIYSGFESVLRQYGTILDVTRLYSLLVDHGNSLSVQNEKGDHFNIRRNLLCALTHEVILNISKTTVKKNEFVETNDMLDFPGARSRMKFNETERLDNKQVAKMLLRGKVAFLFNSYSMNYEINNLFACFQTAKTEVPEIPGLINLWINYNIGETKTERTSTLRDSILPPLFIIFTFWNTQLDFDKDNDLDKGELNPEKLNYKWEHRFNKRIQEDLYGVNIYKWNEEWTEKNTKFQNFYLLRDFKYSNNTFGGFEEETKEKSILRPDYYATLKKSFLQSSLVKDLFSQPEETWENTSTLNHDGSQYIIRNIQQIASNYSKTQRYLAIIETAKKEAENEIKKHYHSDSSDEQIQKAARDGSDIHGRMNMVFGMDAYYFGSFIEHLTISEEDVLIEYHKKITDTDIIKKEQTNPYILIRESSPRLSASKSFDENLEILRQDYNFGDAEEPCVYFEKTLGLDLNELFYGEANDLKNRSVILAESARDLWYEKRLSLSNFSFFIDLGFEKSLLEKLFDNLKLNLKKLKLTEEIALNIREYVDRYNKIDDIEGMIAHIATGIINEFVNSAGWSFYSNADKEKIIESIEKHNINLNIPKSNPIFEAITQERVVELFEMMDKLNENLSKKPIIIDEIKDIPMISNYRRWRELMKISFVAVCDLPSYDPEANKQLGKILERVSATQFIIA